MKRLSKRNINTAKYWDTHQTAMDFGLRQKEYAKLVRKDESVIELGCGLSPFLQEVRAKLKVGVDFSEETIKRCATTYPNVAYVVSSATKTPFTDKQFDVCVAGEIIEHLEKPKDLIKEMLRIAKKRIVISSPILEFKDPEHIWQFSLQDFEKLLPGCTAFEIKSKRFPGRSYLFAYLDI